MLKDKIKKIPIEKDKKTLESTGLTCQTHDSTHETEIIL
jgi:hypothetical protein